MGSASSHSPRLAEGRNTRSLSSKIETIARSTPMVSVSATRMRSLISLSDSIETIASEISRTASL